MLRQEELRATENLQAHLIQQLRLGFLSKEDSRDMEGDVEAGEEESEKSEDLHPHRTGRLSSLMEQIGKLTLVESNHDKNLAFVKTKHQGMTRDNYDEHTSGKEGKGRRKSEPTSASVKEVDGRRKSVGYLNHCYQDDQGNHSHAYQSAPSSESSRTCHHPPPHSDVHNHEANHNHYQGSNSKYEHKTSDNKEHEHYSSDDHNHEHNPNDNHTNEPAGHNDYNNHNTGGQRGSQNQDTNSQQKTSKTQEVTKF